MDASGNSGNSPAHVQPIFTSVSSVLAGKTDEVRRLPDFFWGGGTRGSEAECSGVEWLIRRQVGDQNSVSMLRQAVNNLSLFTSLDRPTVSRVERTTSLSSVQVDTGQVQFCVARSLRRGSSSIVVVVVVRSTFDGILEHLTVESYTVFICQQSYLLLFGIPSPTHSFFPGLKPSFSTNLSHCSPFFLST